MMGLLCLFFALALPKMSSEVDSRREAEPLQQWIMFAFIACTKNLIRID